MVIPEAYNGYDTGESIGREQIASDNGTCKNCEMEEKGEVIEMRPLMTNTVTSGDTEIIAENGVKDNSVPTDRGWAWMVLLGATIQMLIAIGMLKSAGIFFVAFQERFGSSSSMTSLLNTVENAVWSVSALLVMTVGLKFLSGRMIVMVGSVTLCVAYVISSRAEDIKVMLFTFGVIKGFGMACLEPVTITMLGTYFEKRRGLANSIANSGGSLGGLILAPLLTAMFEHYGYAGAMMLSGAFCLNNCISGALFRSPSFYTDRKKKRKVPESKTPEMSEVSDTLILRDKKPPSKERIHSKSIEFIRQQLNVGDNSNITSGSDSDVSKASACMSKKTKRMRTFTDSDALSYTEPDTEVKAVRWTSAEYMGGSQFDIPVVIHFESDCDSRSFAPDISNSNSSCCRSISEMFDFSLFKNPIFIVFLPATGLLCSAHGLCMIYIAPHAKEMGIAPEGIAQLLTIYSAIDMCSRVAIGAVSDKKWIRQSTMIAVCSCIVGMMLNLMTFFNSYGWLILYAVVYGLIGGTYFILYPIVIIEYLTLAKLKSCLGVAILCMAVTVSSTYAILGSLRDSTGSYIVPFHVLGSMALVGGLLMASLPLAEKCHKLHTLSKK